MEFLNDIKNGIEWLINVLSDFFEDLGVMLEMASNALTDILGYADFLPSGYVAVLAIALGVALVYLFVGRE